MNKITNKKIRDFQTIVLAWYKREGRRFPWRKKSLTNYQVIIAEILLQRTKAETVAGFYRNFIEEFPNWTSLAKAETTKLEQLLKPIGLYKQRSARLKALAVEMDKRQGRLPRDRTELEHLPFIGQYIANAIELLIFQSPSPLIDVNMSRLIERFFGPRKQADIRYDPYLQELSRRIVNHDNSKELNWAILDYAAIICKARKPSCSICILSRKCIYFSKYNALYLSGKG